MGQVRNKKTNKIKTWDINSAGYARVTLYSKKHVPQKKRYSVHRLVAMLFVPNIDNLPEVNHKDNKKLNNNYLNLEWVDRKGNEAHSRKYGNKKCFYKPFIVYFNTGVVKNFETKQELATLLGVTSACVKHWLHCTNNGYLNYDIINIHYI